MAKHGHRERNPALQSCDIVTDLAALLDMAGIDGIQQRTLDDMIHQRINPQALLDFADHMHRQSGRRVQFKALVNQFLGNEQAA